MSSVVRSLFRISGCAVAFTLSFIAVCWAIREQLPFQDVPLVRAKIEHFAERHDGYDTLFLGSSRIYYQIIPAIFDQLTAEAGRPTRTFNAAIAGMRPPEDAFYLDTLLRTPPAHLRWVFIELAGLRTAVDRDKIGTVRAVYWHDWERLCLLFQRALYIKPDTKKRKWRQTLKNQVEPLQEFGAHLALFLQHQTNFGRGTILSSQLISRRQPRPKGSGGPLGDDRSGWVPTGRPEVMAGTQLADFYEALAARRAQKPVGDELDPISQQALEIMIEKIEKLGATPVLIVPPTTNRRNFIPTAERAKKTLVLDFCDLEKYPELYEHRYRLDTDHLNTEGAAIFTRLFARTWLEAQSRRP